MATQYAVFGNPIEHSKSPAIHRMFAEQTMQDLVYDKQHIDVDGFREAVIRFFKEGGSGLNVTVPFKLEACELADSLTHRAKQAGAVNTLLLVDGKLKGDNTDGTGLCHDLTKNLGWQLEKSRVLILGAGGAVRGVLNPLLEFDPTSIVIANRTLSKAEALVTLFKSDAMNKNCLLKAAAFDDVEGPFDIIINGTSASLGGALPPLSTDVINHALCYDMMYGDAAAPFLHWAVKNGARSIADGLGMLVEQAAESFFLWRGVRPETKSVIATLRE